jgi:hypothetical protein
MGIWAPEAQWVGPSPNQSGAMVEQRGLVLHIMQGSLAGSISWGKNPASGVSFHFGTRKSDGLVQQLVDTSITAWTQCNGNGRWISVENEDFSGNPLSPAQVESIAKLYARGVREYGWPYALANAPDGRGLGYHAMGGVPWCNHPSCPGQPIIDQRQQILNRAQQINGGGGGGGGGDDVLTSDDVQKIVLLITRGYDYGGYPNPASPDPFIKNMAVHLAGHDLTSQVGQLQDQINALKQQIEAINCSGGGGSGGGASPAQVTTIVRAELDKTKLGT